MAGQGEEHLVEGRTTEADVVDLQAPLVEQAHHGGEVAGTAVDGRRDPMTVVVAARLLGGDRRQDLGDGGEVAGRAGAHLDDVAARLVLQLIGGPRRDDSSVVDDHDIASELIGLFEVLGGEQHVGTVADEVADGVPQLAPAARVETGRGLVEQQESRAPDQAGAEVEPAAHAAGVVADHARAGLGEADALEHLAGSALGVDPVEAEQAGDHLEVLDARHRRLDRGVLPCEPDDLTHLLGFGQHVDPGDPELAGVRPEECADGADERGLPGAVGPEQCGDAPGLGGEVEAGQGVGVPERLREAAGLDDG